MSTPSSLSSRSAALSAAFLGLMFNAVAVRAQSTEWVRIYTLTDGTIGYVHAPSIRSQGDTVIAWIRDDHPAVQEGRKKDRREASSMQEQVQVHCRSFEVELLQIGSLRVPETANRVSAAMPGSSYYVVAEYLCGLRSASATPTPTPVTLQATGRRTGMGFAVTEDGLFLSSASLITRCSKLLVHVAEREPAAEATVLAVDPRTDLALLRTTLPVATPMRFRGEPRLAVSEPVSAERVLDAGGKWIRVQGAKGSVVALTSLDGDSSMLLIAAEFPAGYAGSPLLDASGNLVGVVPSSSVGNAVTTLASLAWAQVQGGNSEVSAAVKSQSVELFLQAWEVDYQRSASAANTSATAHSFRESPPSVAAVECLPMQ